MKEREGRERESEKELKGERDKEKERKSDKRQGAKLGTSCGEEKKLVNKLDHFQFIFSSLNFLHEALLLCTCGKLVYVMVLILNPF